MCRLVLSVHSFCTMIRSRRTGRFKLLEELVVLSAKLCPLCEFVLAARGIQLSANLEVLGLEFALLASSLGGRDREKVNQGPELCASQYKRAPGLYTRCGGFLSYQIVDRRGSHGVDDVNCGLHHEHGDQEVRHVGGRMRVNSRYGRGVCDLSSHCLVLRTQS